MFALLNIADFKLPLLIDLSLSKIKINGISFTVHFEEVNRMNRSEAPKNGDCSA